MEKKKSFWAKLKERWDVDSNFQIAIIFVVFAVTGSSTMFVRKPAFEILGINAATPMWVQVIAYILVVFPAYQVLLLFFGTIFGQFSFFWKFEKKMFSRFVPKRVER